MEFIYYIDFLIFIMFMLAEFAFEHPVLVVLILLEIFPLIFMGKALLYMLFNLLLVKMNYTLNKAAKDKDYQNDVASIIFFFSDMGPSISSFSIIAIFITNNENWFVLTIIFFVGIIIKQRSRTIKKWYYSEIEERKLSWKQQQE